MQSITCPHCSRDGTLREPLPVGSKVRCPGCSNRFEVGPDTDEPIDLGIVVEDDPGFGVLAAQVARRATAPPATPAEDLYDDGLDPPRPSPPAATATPSPGRPAKGWPGVDPTAFVMPREPWFYRWLERMAGFIWYGSIAILAACWVAIVAVIIFAVRAFGQLTPDALGAISCLFFMPLLALLPFGIASALLRLAVDAARNVRTMCYSPR